jgi:hypothetical protein
MIRLLLYALIAFALYRMLFPARRVEQGPGVRDAGGSGSSADEAARRAADREGEYIDYEEVE